MSTTERLPFKARLTSRLCGRDIAKDTLLEIVKLKGSTAIVVDPRNGEHFRIFNSSWKPDYSEMVSETEDHYETEEILQSLRKKGELP